MKKGAAEIKFVHAELFMFIKIIMKETWNFTLMQSKRLL